MKQDRKIRQHITAAKGWLSQAEDSLAQENAIQGDLKLMLAQAELKRAQEKNDKKLCVRWFKRLAPGALACALALGGIIYAQQAEDSQALPKPNPLTSTSLTEQVSSSGTGRDKAMEAKKSHQNLSEEREFDTPAYVQIQPNEEAHSEEVSNTIESRPVEVESQQATSSLKNVQPSKVPAPAMQKLMQSAGSTLRE
mgnify:CR=1 FL=1